MPDDERLRVMMSLVDKFEQELDHTALVWDWPGFLDRKPAKVRDRALKGRASLEKKGFVFSSAGWTVGATPPDMVVELFVKREFYDYTPNLDKAPKPRIISCCSNEILALLGPFMHSLTAKLKLMPCLVKHLAPSSLGSRVVEIDRAGQTWCHRPFASDFECFDRTQDQVVMAVQLRMFRLLGLPACAANLLAQYDMSWTAISRAGVFGRWRSVVLRFASHAGIRKTGDPHTSDGNNLWHWTMLRMFLASFGESMSDVCAIINGDDFLGVFRRHNFAEYSEFVSSMGLAVARGDPHEFCGGYYMGASNVFVRDPHRALFKIGWSLHPTSTPEAYFKSSLICETYLTSQNPILAAYVSHHLRQLRSTSLITLPEAYLSNLSFRLMQLWGGVAPTGVSPEFRVDVPLDVRAAYSEMFGIPIWLQLAAEQHLMQTGNFLPLLGLLLR